MERLVGWRPETAEEVEEREKFVRLKIWRLDQDKVKVGAVHNYFGQPDKKVKIINKLYIRAPTIQVVPFPSCNHQELNTIFADKLEAKRHCLFPRRRRQKRKRHHKAKEQEQEFKDPGKAEKKTLSCVI